MLTHKNLKLNNITVLVTLLHIIGVNLSHKENKYTFIEKETINTSNSTLGYSVDYNLGLILKQNSINLGKLRRLDEKINLRKTSSTTSSTSENSDIISTTPTLETSDTTSASPKSDNNEISSVSPSIDNSDTPSASPISDINTSETPTTCGSDSATPTTYETEI